MILSWRYLLCLFNKWLLKVQKTLSGWICVIKWGLGMSWAWVSDSYNIGMFFWQTCLLNLFSLKDKGEAKAIATDSEMLHSTWWKFHLVWEGFEPH